MERCQFEFETHSIRRLFEGDELGFRIPHVLLVHLVRQQHEVLRMAEFHLYYDDVTSVSPQPFKYARSNPPHPPANSDPSLVR